jgi:hypothetical protein
MFPSGNGLQRLNTLPDPLRESLKAFRDGGSLHGHGWVYWDPDPSEDVVKAYLLKKREWISIKDEVYPFVYSWKRGNWVILEP